MRRALLVTCAAALALAPVATAKGPDQATITGPGLDSPIVLSGDAESNFTTQFARFVNGTGFVSGVFQQSPDPMLETRPDGDLGARYVVVYRVPGGGSGLGFVRQDLYPNAENGPVSYMRPGQLIFGGDHATRGGWFVSRQGAELRKTLASLGVPVARAESENRRALRWLPLAFVGLLLPAAFVAAWRRSK